ncbi:MAG: helix-turn-helix transcriptional regulator [Cyanobacteria bacterium P01_F01_bin.3]
MDVRKTAGLTQAKMSALLEVRQATLSDWENERTVPRLRPSQWFLLLSASGLTPEQLVEAFEPGEVDLLPMRLKVAGISE